MNNHEQAKIIMNVLQIISINLHFQFERNTPIANNEKKCCFSKGNDIFLIFIYSNGPHLHQIMPNS